MALEKEITSQILALLGKNPYGLSVTDIARSVRINRNTAGRYMENLLVSGQVEMHRSGMAKIYIPSQRVPLSAVLSLSSDLVIQLDRFQRIIFVNEPFLKLIGTDSRDLLGKNIEFTPVVTVFDQSIAGFLERVRRGIAGEDWAGEIELSTQGVILFCRIAPTVFEDGRKGVSAFFENITQRKKAEDALRESEEKFRTLFEGALNPIMMVNDQGRYIEANEAALRFLETTREELLQKTVWDYSPKELFESQIREHSPFTSPRTLETVYFVNGRYKTLILNIIPMSIQGAPILIGMGQDITERKQAEQALRESEERYRQLVEISPDAVLIHEEGKIIYLNPAALTMLGGEDPGEILGKNILDLIHPDFRHAVRINIGRDLQGEMTPPTEVEMIRTDGTMITVEGRGIRTTYNGRPAVQVAIRDTTERHRMDEKLRESEDKYQFFINRALNGICVIQDGIIKVCNRRASGFYGDSIENIVGRVFTDFIHPDALSDLTDRYQQRMAGEKIPPVYETVLMRKDGSRFFAEMNAGIISYEGKPADLVFIRDINERKKTEDALREIPWGTRISDDLSFLVTGIKPSK